MRILKDHTISTKTYIIAIFIFNINIAEAQNKAEHDMFKTNIYYKTDSIKYEARINSIFKYNINFLSKNIIFYSNILHKGIQYKTNNKQ